MDSAGRRFRQLVPASDNRIAPDSIANHPAALDSAALDSVAVNSAELDSPDGPLCIVGTINAYTALMATQLGHRAIYLSGAGCANYSYGLPDLGMTTLPDILVDVRRITSAVDTPLLVDIDTGWGGSFNIGRAIREMIRAGAAAVHIEDQVFQKRCGHRPNKELVSLDEMQDRVRSAVDARDDPDFFIMARTDAYSVEGLDAAIERANRYVAAGADGIFAEAMESLDDYRRFCQQVNAPVLANLTEFGRTPLFARNELAETGVGMILYPLTAARMMNRAAEDAYRTLLEEPNQQGLLERMQTREQLYRYLNYLEYEQQLDRLAD